MRCAIHPVTSTLAKETKEVKRFADLFEAAVRSGTYIPCMKLDDTAKNAFGITVSNFIEHHYFPRVKARLSPNTIRFYRSITEQFIIPSFGDIRLCDITAQHQQAFIDYLLTDGARADENNTQPLSAATVKRYATVFSSVMTEASERVGYDSPTALSRALKQNVLK